MSSRSTTRTRSSRRSRRNSSYSSSSSSTRSISGDRADASGSSSSIGDPKPQDVYPSHACKDYGVLLTRIFKNLHTAFRFQIPR